jgi:hypothetical protein
MIVCAYVNNLLYRKISVPNFISLSDLGYYVLSAFDVDEYYEYFYEKDQLEYPSNYKIDAYSFLPCTMLYEEFEIQLEIEDEAESTCSLIGGRGYGLWLECSEFMDLFYESYESFEEYCTSNDIDLDFFPIDEDFDYETCSMMLEENYLMIKDVYENDGYEG